MAIICLTRFMKCSHTLIFLRLLNQGRAWFSNSVVLSAKDSNPVKYTSNTAAGLRIAETIGLERPKRDDDDISRYARYIIVGSIAIFLIYFCILREENDIDDILRGDKEVLSEARQLVDLQMKLKFCEQNNLPRDAIKSKIEELQNKRPYVSPFIK